MEVYIFIVIPRGSRAHITTASLEKSQLWKIFTVFDLSENVRIDKDRSYQHLGRCLLIFGNGDLPIAEQPDSIHIPPVNLCEIQDDSGIAIRVSIRHLVERIFPDITANFNIPEHQWIFG